MHGKVAPTPSVMTQLEVPIKVSGSNNPIFAEFQAIIQPFSLEVFCNPILSNYVGFYISVVIKTQLMSNINTTSFSP